ncbi:14194_t:CDS:2 [Dentiscutata erythropus]|uniref:14194_t:CDS:1 n=1 Tax=Dentiscutata erythropus TaxID=1348616 RepID=A0A9N9CV65_9GLOM|nr:14194_t:CDS:2 [Dentiscutata erythropus]
MVPEISIIARAGWGRRASRQRASAACTKVGAMPHLYEGGEEERPDKELLRRACHFSIGFFDATDSKRGSAEQQVQAIINASSQMNIIQNRFIDKSKKRKYDLQPDKLRPSNSFNLMFRNINDHNNELHTHIIFYEGREFAIEIIMIKPLTSFHQDHSTGERCISR